MYKIYVGNKSINEGRYKWTPSRSQRIEFAQKMNNEPEFATDYYKGKEVRAQKRREDSRFDYSTAGGEYVPTKYQYDFTMSYDGDLTSDQENAFNMVRQGFIYNDKIYHDYIHIVNKLIRENQY
tara:strand:+ start:272 stop:643 length:372 start_codon:yes stop_codon:yes gene_type:complete